MMEQHKQYNPPDLTQNWKKSSFQDQLHRNIYELNNKYPPHWDVLIDFLSQIEGKTLIDVGCGVGSISELLKIHYPEIIYVGIDYSENAINLAKQCWRGSFFVQDYNKITPQVGTVFDILYSSALADILPNGDDCINKLLTSQCKNIILQRLKTTDKESYYNIYTVYDEVETYEFYHNSTNLERIINDNNYSIIKQVDLDSGRNYLLKLN